MTMEKHTLGKIQSRRRFLEQTACGLGGMALWQLMADDAGLKPHFAPRAKNVIFLFMPGAPSQLDLLDPKPVMKKYHGQLVPAHMLDNLDDALIRGSARVFASPRTFKQYGQSGIPFSDYLPHLGRIADDICLVRSMHTNVANHTPGQLLMNCGQQIFGHPSMGSWVTYGLGSENRNLPGFVVMTSNSGSGIDAGTANWSNGFLPSEHRGVTFRASGDPVLNLSNPKGISATSQRARLDAMADLNRQRLARIGDPEIASRIAAYEMAFRMQSAAPELLDFSGETKATREMYGLDNDTTKAFGTNCLLARRMIERGVRFVQLYHSTWDDHSNLNTKLKQNCDMTDRGTAALVLDLKQRGLLDDTLVIWGGEFGRTPMNEVRRGNKPGKEGRDHHPFAFSMWLAGGGAKAGCIIGATDELGYHITRDPIHVHDLQATILHCLGLNHEKLTYRHAGLDARLTNVSGEVVTKMLA
jgi:hypothetical protein